MIAQSLLENKRLDHAVRYVRGEEEKKGNHGQYLSLSFSLPLYLGYWDRRFFEQEKTRRG